jgi:hypothetical protein
MKIDLHGLRHHKVRNHLIREIENLWNSGTDVEIITGHSQTMQKIVINVLNEYKLEYNIGGWLGTNKGFVKTII